MEAAVVYWYPSQQFTDCGRLPAPENSCALRASLMFAGQIRNRRRSRTRSNVIALGTVANGLLGAICAAEPPVGVRAGKEALILRHDGVFDQR